MHHNAGERIRALKISQSTVPHSRIEHIIASKLYERAVLHTKINDTMAIGLDEIQ